MPRSRVALCNRRGGRGRTTWRVVFANRPGGRVTVSAPQLTLGNHDLRESDVELLETIIVHRARGLDSESVPTFARLPGRSGKCALVWGVHVQSGSNFVYRIWSQYGAFGRGLSASIISTYASSVNISPLKCMIVNCGSARSLHGGSSLLTGALGVEVALFVNCAACEESELSACAFTNSFFEIKNLRASSLV